jgi:MFS family permease
VLPPPLRNREFRLFVTGGFLSAAGTQMTTVAMAWHIYQLTDSPLAVGFLGLSRALPQIVLALLGGLLADTLDRRRLLMALQLGSCAVSSTLAILTFLGAITPSTLVAAAVLIAFATALETPGRQAAVPNLVPTEQLSPAIALNTFQRSLAMIVGPALAGVALAVAGPALCYTVDAASWLAMLVALVLIRKPLQTSLARPTLGAILDGARFVRTQHVILAFMILDFGATFFGSSTALLPIYARDILRVGPQGLGLLYASSSIGAVAAAAVLSSLHIDRTGRWVLAGVVLYAVCTIGFALAPVLWLAALMLVGSGVGNMVSAVLRGTTNQRLTPDHLRGRVAAVNSAFVTGGPQLGQFESGLIADLGGAQLSAVTGGLGALLLVGALALVPEVRSFSLAGSLHAQPSQPVRGQASAAS